MLTARREQIERELNATKASKDSPSRLEFRALTRTIVAVALAQAAFAATLWFGHECEVAQSVPDRVPAVVLDVPPSTPDLAPVVGPREWTPAACRSEISITQMSERQFCVSRSFVASGLEATLGLRSSGRIIPHEEHGRVVGVKIYGVGRQSLLGRLGIDNGDMVVRVNGYDVTTPDSVLKAYTELRSVGRYSVEMVRAGRQIVLEYYVVS